MSVSVTNNPPPLLPGSDFIRLASPKRQCVALIMGDDGQGKDHFPLFHAPEPVALINLDGRAEHVVADALAAGRQILYTAVAPVGDVVKLTPDQARTAARDALARVWKNVSVAAKEAATGKVRTLVIDTGTELVELQKLAAQGTLEKANDYGATKDKISVELWNLYRTVRRSNLHFVMLARPQEVWQANAPTGKFKPRGHETLSAAADWAAMVKLTVVAGVPGISLTVTKAGVNAATLGKVYKEADWGPLGPFVGMCMESYPGSEPGDWM